jgi:hypothetical protein
VPPRLQPATCNLQRTKSFPRLLPELPLLPSGPSPAKTAIPQFYSTAAKSPAPLPKPWRYMSATALRWCLRPRTAIYIGQRLQLAHSQCSNSTTLLHHTPALHLITLAQFSSLTMALPLGLFYPSVGASVGPLGDVSSFWSRTKKGLNIKRVLLNKRRSRDARARSATPLVDARYDPVVVPERACTSIGLKSFRALSIRLTTGPRLSGHSVPSDDSLSESTCLQSRHAETLILNLALPVHPFLFSYSQLPVDLGPTH